jgi:Ca2+-binding RTX toxin-like protein
MEGIYFYSDYCSGRIWGLKYNGTAWQDNDPTGQHKPLLDTPYKVTAFGEDEAGNLYLADYSGGKIYQIKDTYCAGVPATIVGTSGSNTLSGTPGADVIQGLGGSDNISSGGGNDRICGGTGNDTLSGGGGNDRLYGESGDDVLNGGPGTGDICDGGTDTSSGNDSATGCETKTNIP